MKKDFKKPELEVVHINNEEIITTSSQSMPICTTDCLDGAGCSGPGDVIFGG